MLVLLLGNIYYFAGLPSAVDVCDIFAAVAKCSSCEFLLLLLVSLLNVAVISTVADCRTVCSGGPTAFDIHDVPIVPAAAGISDFNSVSAVVGLGFGYWTQKNYRLLASAGFTFISSKTSKNNCILMYMYVH
jgi:hypothetical protein